MRETIRMEPHLLERLWPLGARRPTRRVVAACLIATGLPTNGFAEDAAAYEPDPIELDAEFLRHASWVETGAVVPTDDSYRSGDFVGLEKRRIDLLGNLDLRGETNWDSEAPRAWRLQGSNLGLSSRRLRFDYGSQGRYRLRLHFDQIPKLREDRGGVFFDGLGESSLTLPTGFVRGEEPGDLSTLGQTLREPRIRHERRRSGGAFTFSPGEDWNVELGYDRETKQGSKLVGMVVGTNGGNAVAVIAPEPLDFETRKIHFLVENRGERGQMALRYETSVFENRKRAVTWQSPFLPPGVGNTFTATDFASKGQLPDNQFQQLRFDAGYALPLQSRVTLNAAYGTMEQDQGFQPYTLNPAVTVTTALPRSSLHGRIETTFVRLGLVSRPAPRLELRAAWRLDDRDNQTPQSVYRYVSSDSGDQGALASGNARINVPYGYRSNQLELGSTYSVARHTTVGLQYAFETQDRSFTEVDTLRESRVDATLQSRLGEKMRMRVKAGWSGRRGSSYESDAPFLDGRTPEFLATLAPTDRLDNAPELRRSYLADRVRMESTARLTYLASESITVGWTGRFARDDYDRTSLGLTEVESVASTLDVSYDASEDLHTYLYYTYQRVARDDASVNVGANFSGASNPGNLYGEDTTDTTNSLGIGVRTEWLDGRLTVEGDYSFTFTTDDIDVGTGASLAAGVDLPENDLRRHEIRLFATYALRADMQIRFGYQFAKLDETDFAYEDVTTRNLPDLLTLAQGSPDHRTSIFSIAVRWTLD